MRQTQIELLRDLLIAQKRRTSGQIAVFHHQPVKLGINRVAIDLRRLCCSAGESQRQNRDEVAFHLVFPPRYLALVVAIAPSSLRQVMRNSYALPGSIPLITNRWLVSSSP